ncbi:MAG: hypothetical protein FJZ01_06250 [Candidatus Sericytochromatia bacterium]|nr:hypothetical protein [Candidatus Tanganyikabacteria bacterium]
MATVQGAASKIQAPTQIEAPKAPARKAKVEGVDPRPEIDSVALTGVATHDGQAIQTATRAKGVPDAEVKYRQALREFLRGGADYKGAEKVLGDSGVAAKEIAKIQAEEASSYFRMSRDEFVRTADEHMTLSARFGPKPRPQAVIRLESLKRSAHTAFEGAVRADALLGGLDPQRGQDLAAMEAVLLRMGFPKDQVVISSRQAKPAL